MTPWEPTEADEQSVRMPQDEERELIEIELLLEGMHRLYGYDFRNYALPSLRRRIWHYAHSEGLKTISGLQEKVLHERSAFERFVQNLSIPVTEMFRDPALFRTFREKIIPVLRTYPYIRIWHAGCSTGEEVYSMAIMLHEEGLYDKARIYATDMNDRSLQQAKEGVYGIEKMKLYTTNYLEAGVPEPSPNTIQRSITPLCFILICERTLFLQSIIWQQTGHLTNLTLSFAATS